MRPHSHMWDVYAKLTGEVLGTVGAALPVPSQWVEDDRPETVRAAASTWQPAGPRLMSNIDAQLDALGDGIVAISTTSDLTEPAKSARIQALSAEVRSNVTAIREDVLARAGRVVDGLRAASFPKRPDASAASEAALVGVKSDLIMVLSPLIEGHSVIGRMSDRLSRALSD